MLIRFTRPAFVGTRTHAVGEVAELPDEQAKQVIEAGHGQPAKAGQQLETATLSDANGNETATTTTTRKGRGKAAK
jgi:hypothetical protein